MTVSQHTSLRPEQLRDAASRLRERGGRMQMVYAWYPEARRVELRYVVTEPHQHAFGIWVCEPQSGVPSLASVWPLMG
jgi:formate hydrogenlyase subunit 5